MATESLFGGTKLAATITVEEAIEKNPGFLDGKPDDVLWGISVEGGEPVIGDWESKSRFGSFKNVVVADADGKPQFIRPECREAPHMHMLVWGQDQRTGEYRIGMIEESRPHADNPVDPDSKEPVIFLQIPMGFANKAIGADLVEKFESGRDAAIRETAEETGAGVILSIDEPAYPWGNVSPSFVATWAGLLFVQVDLEQLEAIRPDRGEPIFRANFYSVKELMEIIRNGVNENGAVARSIPSLSMLMLWLAYHHEALG